MHCMTPVLLVAMLFGNAARAQNAAAPSDQTLVQHIITEQIDAFRRDDAMTAFSLAAPHIKAMFGDASHFLAMVRQAYPLVYRPRAFIFGSSTISHGLLIQKVQLMGENGDEALALYQMEKEADGSWHIAGCSLIESKSQEI